MTFLGKTPSASKTNLFVSKYCHKHGLSLLSKILPLSLHDGGLFILSEMLRLWWHSMELRSNDKVHVLKLIAYQEH